MKWTKITEKVRPEFNKQYLLGRAHKNFFYPEYVSYGYLEKIERKKDKDGEVETLVFYVARTGGFPNPFHYWYESDITHFIEIENLPTLTNNNQQ